MMIPHQSSDAGRQSPENEKPAGQKDAESNEDICRCKEVSKKTPVELLKLMISDLAFWKKKK